MPLTKVRGSVWNTKDNFGMINIRDTPYGARGNGSTNDTTAIQTAINATTPDYPYIYAPAGTYVITSTLNKTSAPHFRGIVGDCPRNSTFKGTTLTSHAMDFVDIAFGTRFENFGIEGPGQSAGVTSSALRLPKPGTVGEPEPTNQNYLQNLFFQKFPTHGIFGQIPILTHLQNIECQLIGTAGFYLEQKPSNSNVGGTSTVWTNCYANNCLGKGFYLRSHVYFVMNGCAADNCNDAYFIENCSGGVINGSGYEIPTYINSSLPGRGLVTTDCRGMTINSFWEYNPSSNINAAMKMIEMIGTCTGITINSPTRVGMNEAPASYTTTDIVISAASFQNTINNPIANGRTDDKAIVTNNGYDNLITYGKFMTEIKPNNVVVTGDNGVDGTAVNVSQGNISITKSSNPQLIITNTNPTPDQTWVVSNDNGGGLSFYNATAGVTDALLWNRDSIAGQNGILQMTKGWRVTEGGQLFIKDDGSDCASGIAVFGGGTTLVVNNTLVKTNSRILLSIHRVFSGNPAIPYISAVVNNTSFTITMSAAFDGSIFYVITEP